MTLSNVKNDISRRRFLGMATGAAGLAMLSTSGLSGWASNVTKIDPAKLTNSEHETDVLVIGGGMAGLFAAVKAHDAGAKVLMVSKGRLGSSGQTPFAKGIFAYDANNEEVSIDEFVEKVSASALGSNNQAYTRQMAEHSLARVNELREWGFFDSPLYNNSFSKPISERNIPLIERLTITHLIKENGKIVGAAGFSIDEQKVHFFKAKSVILCTGAGGFKPNGFPICDLTHDGTIMAYNIGAKVTGKEWNDGHPGQSTNAAACYDGWHGMFDRKPGLTGVEIHHDLGVDLNYIVYKTGNPVQSMGPGSEKNSSVEGGPYRPNIGQQRSAKQGEERSEGRPPRDGREGDEGRPPRDGRDGEEGRPPREKGDRPGGKGSDEGGAPPGMGGSVVGGSSAGMAIHKSEGLVPINEKCESTIPGLYAAGDALGSYMAGAIYTQIGSSLAGSAVQGAVAGEAAAEYSSKVAASGISQEKMDQIREEILAPLNREAGYSPAWITQTLQGIMIPNFILYIKKENLMQAALAYIEELRDYHMPFLKAADMHELRLAHETRNMIISAEMKLKASLMRTESRCSHYRLDYPDLDNENWLAWINIFKGEDGTMQFEKQPFGSWPTSDSSLI
ncbi:FAD-dependent oxidoreductase [Mangrovibacterium sp.]|uniref:FAD-dependent oxidoreductase n=1 Tax=Mangrovibacterium sp. TaxID=1961364 RepID=UPI003565FBC0